MRVEHEMLLFYIKEQCIEAKEVLIIKKAIRYLNKSAGRVYASSEICFKT